VNKVILFFILLVLWKIAYLQISAGPDTTICTGQSVVLQGSGPFNFEYTWTSIPNDPTISNPNILNPTVNPSDTTVYTLEGREVHLINLVNNGDFEGGNTGFTSDYLYSPGANGLWNEGTYAITEDAHFNHNNFFCNNDYTINATFFFFFYSASQTNVVVWSTTVSGIVPNTEYEFST